MWPDERNPVFGEGVNNKGAEEPAHTHSLISAFVIHSLESIMSKLAAFFCLVSVAEQAALDMTWSNSPKTGFLATGPIAARSITASMSLK